MTTGWRGNHDGIIAYSTEGVTLTATATEQGAVFDVQAPTQLEGATIDMVVNVSSELKISGAALQPFAQLINGTDYPGEWNCWIGNDELVAGEDQTVSCTIAEGGKFDQADYKVQIGVQAIGVDTPVSGTVLIKSVTIKLASGSSSSSSLATILSYDFEADELGSAYPGASWDAGDVISTVISVSDSPDLAVGNDSLKALYVLVGNYNAGPLFNITLPAGKTLNDYTVKVDAYLPHQTLGGNSAGGGNFYKDLLVLAGVEISSSVNVNNPDYQGSIPTEGNVDVWRTFTLPVDPVKGAELTGAIQLAFGLNRPGGTDGYYFDNLKLEPK